MELHVHVYMYAENDDAGVYLKMYLEMLKVQWTI